MLLTRNVHLPGLLAKARICSFKIQQGIPFPNYYIFNFRDKNGVIAGILRRMQPALKVGERSTQNGRAVRSAIEPRPHMLPIGMVWDWKRVVLGDPALIRRQDIHSEAPSGMKVSVGSGFLVHANQYQEWIERDRTERIRGHAMYLPLILNTDNCNSRGEASHRSAKLRLSDHVVLNVLPLLHCSSTIRFAIWGWL